MTVFPKSRLFPQPVRGVGDAVGHFFHGHECSHPYAQARSGERDDLQSMDGTVPHQRIEAAVDQTCGLGKFS
jgi:hypothetical protein